MTWTTDHLTQADTLIFQSALVKVGHFACNADDPCFAVTEALDNDVFVLPRNPIWFRRGCGDYQFAEPGGLLLHRAGGVVERRGTSKIGDNAYWFGVHPDIFAAALTRHKLPTDNMGCPQLASPRLHHRLLSLVNRLKQGIYDRLTVEEDVLSMFEEICHQRSAGPKLRSRLETAIRRRRITDRARAFVDAQLNVNIGIDDIARGVGASPYHLCRIFKQQTGMTLHGYRVRQRIGRVLDRLIADDASSVSALAHENGFSSHSHLCRVFQRQLGYSPTSLPR